LGFQDRSRAIDRHVPDKTYLVKFKNPDLAPQLVKAATIEIHGEHLVFCRVDGEIAALFLLEIVEDWEHLRDI
jgi:hypothetical protein